MWFHICNFMQSDRQSGVNLMLRESQSISQVSRVHPQVSGQDFMIIHPFNTYTFLTLPSLVSYHKPGWWARNLKKKSSWGQENTCNTSRLSRSDRNNNSKITLWTNTEMILDGQTAHIHVNTCYCCFSFCHSQQTVHSPCHWSDRWR